MNSFRVCTKTIMDTSDPNIRFNEKGESDYYVNLIEKISPNWYTDERGNEELMKIAKKTYGSNHFDFCL